MRQFLLFVVLPLLVLLGGCSTFSPTLLRPAHVTALDHFKLAGRISVSANGTNSYGNFEWQRVATQDTLALTTPLGQTVALIQRDASGITLTANTQTRHAENVEQLTEDMLGWPLPLDNLSWWISGTPAPNSPSQMRAQGFEQNGWQIDYRQWQSGPSGVRPGVVMLERANLSIRIAINNWEQQIP